MATSDAHAVEHELLLLCARMSLDAEAQGRVRKLLGSQIDWDFLIRAANDHAVLPLLNRTLHETSPDTVSDSALAQIRRDASAIAVKNLRLTGELLRVLKIFDANQISAIPYKGPILAASLYGSLSLRQFHDLDIIVQEDKVPQALELLEAEGYRHVVSSEKDISLLHDARGPHLELHWGITTADSPIQIRPERLWRNLKPFMIAGRIVKTFTAEDLLLILCIHGTKHCWGRLGWLCDVAEIVRISDVDWNLLIDEATRLRGRRILLSSLLLAKDVLGARVPEGVLAQTDADPVIRDLTREVHEWLRHPPTQSGLLGTRERYFIKLREHRLDRLRIGVRQVAKYFAPTSMDREALPLPALLSPLLYLIRPIRLIRGYGFAPFRRFLKDGSSPDQTKRDRESRSKPRSR